jgi:hypothetical protein
MFARQPPHCEAVSVAVLVAEKIESSPLLKFHVISMRQIVGAAGFEPPVPNVIKAAAVFLRMHRGVVLYK